MSEPPTAAVLMSGDKYIIYIRCHAVAVFFTLTI